jgi:hypothetical protein
MTTNDKSQLVDDVERIALLVSAAPKDRRSELRKAIEWMMVGMQIAVEDSEKPPA